MFLRAAGGIVETTEHIRRNEGETAPRADRREGLHTTLTNFACGRKQDPRARWQAEIAQDRRCCGRAGKGKLSHFGGTRTRWLAPDVLGTGINPDTACGWRWRSLAPQDDSKGGLAR